MTPTGMVLLAASATSIFAGLLFFLRKSWTEESLYSLVSIGGGLLFAMTLLDLLPQAAQTPRHMPFVLIGFLLLFLVDSHTWGRASLPKSWREAAFPRLEGDSAQLRSQSGAALRRSWRETALSRIRGGSPLYRSRRGVTLFRSRTGSLVFAFLLHSLVEGMALAASFRVEMKDSLLLVLAMLIHKIPDGLTVGSLLLVASGTRVVAFLGASSLGVATLLGALSLHWTAGWMAEGHGGIILAFSTGIFLYVSSGHLIPMIQEQRGRMPLFFFGGILIYMFLQLFPPFHVHFTTFHS